MSLLSGPLCALLLLGAAAAPVAAPAEPNSPEALEERGAALEKTNDFPGAIAAFREALAIRRERAELSAAADDLQHLGSIEFQRGNLDESERSWKDCLEIRRKASPRTKGEAAAWNGLGAIAYFRGDLDAAEELYEKALEIDAVAAPESIEAARTTGNLGLVAFYRGDLDRAEELFRRDLAMQEKIDRDGVEQASPLNYLGVVAKNRGDFDSAGQYYARALAIFEKKSPGSIAIGGMENNLGVLCKERGDLAGAERHQRAALDIRRKLAPDSLDVAASLNNLAELALLRGDPDSALPEIREALAIKEKLAPESLAVTSTLMNLAEYDLRKNDPAGALTEGRRILAIRGRLAPETLDLAETFALVARAERAAGNADQAARDYGNAIAAVEAQSRRVGGAEEERAAFSTRAVGFFRDAVELLHDLGRDGEAFDLLERSRARELLSLVGARDLRVDADAPAELRRERQRLDRLYDRAQQQLGRIDPVGRKEEADKLVARLVDLRGQRAAVEQKIWSSSPRRRELESPRALTLAEARRALDPGTTVLSFSVGVKNTLIFAVPPGTASLLRVTELPLGAEELRREVEIFRNLIRQEKDDPSVRSAREEAGRRLSGMLLSPAADAIARSRRVLLCPDGPLHLLPFAALPALGAGSGRFLAEWRPLHVALSVSLAVERAKRRGAPANPALQIAAFADPVLPRETLAARTGSDFASVAERARSLGPLPASREEARSVASLFGRSSAEFTGAEATESQAAATIGGARFVHFACHAILDSRFPLDSALVLAAPAVDRPGDDNGLLQAWEIYERIRLSADLVTLSACETALGRDSGGEGLAGLVRAFQFAGARSVLASLWNIADRSTPAFMTRFYRAVRSGRPMDEALQEAQRASIRSGGVESAPYSWAAFELIGDFR